jgi:hypothetical protein
MSRHRRVRIAGAAALALFAGTAGAQDTAGTPVTVTGEAIDSWCYFSGVMGGPAAVVGSAHHTCALWCAAGGIPVGLLADDGTVYMVLKLGAEANAAGGDSFLRVASHRLTAAGTLHVRDGVNYIVVAEVIADAGITERNHDAFGVVPHFAIPEAARE